MPFESEHAARISEPSKYERFRRKNDEFGSGIDVIYGITSSGKAEVQSIRFDSNKFTPEEAKKWLKDHDYKPLEFSSASKTNFNEIEYKTFKFSINSFEETKSKNGNYGIIKGYASTFDNIDLGNDAIMKGAFIKTIDDHRLNNKLITMCYQHEMMNPIGGFNPTKMYEDHKGLYVEGDINLDTSKGRDVYALVKQGIVDSMSIGFVCNDHELAEEKNDDGSFSHYRKIKEVTLHEITLTHIPMNPNAEITDCKSLFQDIPIANESVKWEEEDAIKRIKKFTNSENKPTETYKKAFIWYNKSLSNDFNSYKLPFVDIIDNKMMAIPKAIFAAAKTLGIRNDDINIPENKINEVKMHINKYYDKLGMESPLKGINIDGVVTWNDLQDNKLIEDNDLQSMRKSEIERILRETKRFSRSAAKYLVSCLHFEKKNSKLNLDNEQLLRLYNVVKQRDAVPQNKTQNINQEDLQSLLLKIKERNK